MFLMEVLRTDNTESPIVRQSFDAPLTMADSCCRCARTSRPVLDRWSRTGVDRLSAALRAIPGTAWGLDGYDVRRRRRRHPARTSVGSRLGARFGRFLEIDGKRRTKVQMLKSAIHRRMKGSTAEAGTGNPTQPALGAPPWSKAINSDSSLYQRSTTSFPISSWDTSRFDPGSTRTRLPSKILGWSR
jgi:hypothetical protein